MSYTIHKAKLPKSEVYPTKTIAIDTIISKSMFGKEGVNSIEYKYTQHPKPLFEVFFGGLKVKEHAEVNRGKLSISVYACSIKDIEEAKQKLSVELETSFLNWLNALAQNKFDWCNETRGYYVYL